MTHPTPAEAFKIWYAAYTANYGGTGLVEGEMLAQQAWQAALNYAGTDGELGAERDRLKREVEAMEEVLHKILDATVGIAGPLYPPPEPVDQLQAIKKATDIVLAAMERLEEIRSGKR